MIKIKVQNSKSNFSNKNNNKIIQIEICETIVIRNRLMTMVKRKKITEFRYWKARRMMESLSNGNEINQCCFVTY